MVQELRKEDVTLLFKEPLIEEVRQKYICYYCH